MCIRDRWGPDARTVAGQAKEIEKARGSAERAVREGYRTLSAKSDAVEQRVVAREQAGFSAEREMICRDFQREGQFGFCGARITEARAASLRARLGLNTEPKPAAAKPKPRPRRSRPHSRSRRRSRAGLVRARRARTGPAIRASFTTFSGSLPGPRKAARFFTIAR